MAPADLLVVLAVFALESDAADLGFAVFFAAVPARREDGLAVFCVVVDDVDVDDAEPDDENADDVDTFFRPGLRPPGFFSPVEPEDRRPGDDDDRDPTI